MSTDPIARSLRIGLLGFGEVGQRFGADLRARGVETVLAYDVLLDGGPGRAPMLAHAARHAIGLEASTAGLVAGSDLIISAVTADQTLAAAQAAAVPAIAGKWFLDLNSASPATKTDCSRLISQHDGRYVEAAVMTAVPPYGIRVPMLLGGPHAAGLEAGLRTLGFAVEIASEDIGVASAIKLCRSVIIKGLESLVVESFTAARAFGVEDRVLASLKETYPEFDWEQHGDYLFSRVIQHGRRRAEEMRASAAMVAATGIDGFMAEAASRRQAFVARLRDEGVFPEPQTKKSWRERADQILGQQEGESHS